MAPPATSASLTIVAPAPAEEPGAPNGAQPQQPPQPSPQSELPIFSDDWKEAGRKDMRSVFDYERWKMHRSSGRYLRHVVGLMDSNILGGLVKPLAYVACVSMAVMAYNLLVEAGKLPLWPVLNVAANAPFGLTSFALSLLLVFRTNASYGRFDEARKLWGLIVNKSRDLVRLAEGYLPPSQAAIKAAVARWTVAYTKALMCHVREGERLEEEVSGVLRPEELAALLRATHRPLYCCQVLTSLVRQAQLRGQAGLASEQGAPAELVPTMASFRLDEGIATFTDVAGACERLLRTPIPLSYTRHTSRFMMIWLTLLPFTLWSACRWAMLPVTLVVAFLLLGIEEIGVAIEEPFSILPLEAICRTIQGNVEEVHAVGPAVQEAALAQEPTLAA